MSTKLFLATAVLGLAGLSTAFANSYEIFFNTPVEAGPVQLPAGTYDVTQHGASAATFRNLDTGKVYVTPAKVEHLASKNQTVNVKLKNHRIEKIELGGQATDLQFGD